LLGSPDHQFLRARISARIPARIPGSSVSRSRDPSSLRRASGPRLEFCSDLKKIISVLTQSQSGCYGVSPPALPLSLSRFKSSLLSLFSRPSLPLCNCFSFSGSKWRRHSASMQWSGTHFSRGSCIGKCFLHVLSPDFLILSACWASGLGGSSGQLHCPVA
jgi:hypothetical protein